MQLQSIVGNFYGFALARSLASDEGTGLTAHGTLYKALTRMTDANLLEATWEDASIAEAEGRPRRRLYTVTAEGQRIAAQARAATNASASLRPTSGMAFV